MPGHVKRDSEGSDLATKYTRQSGYVTESSSHRSCNKLIDNKKVKLFRLPHKKKAPRLRRAFKLMQTFTRQRLLSFLSSCWELLTNFTAIAFRATHAVHSTAETQCAQRLIFFKEAACARAQPVSAVVPAAAFVNT